MRANKTPLQSLSSLPPLHSNRDHHLVRGLSRGDLRERLPAAALAIVDRPLAVGARTGSLPAIRERCLDHLKNLGRASSAFDFPGLLPPLGVALLLEQGDAPSLFLRERLAKAANGLIGERGSSELRARVPVVFHAQRDRLSKAQAAHLVDEIQRAINPRRETRGSDDF